MTYNNALEQVKAEGERVQYNAVRLAVVTGLSNGRAKIKFYGDENESVKLYPYIVGYTPAVGDNVMLVAQASTYIIVGKYSNDNFSEQDSYLTSAMGDGKYAAINHDHTGEYVPVSEQNKLKNGSYEVDLNTSGALVPKTNKSNNIGSSSLYWGEGYIDKLTATYFSGSWRQTATATGANYTIGWSNGQQLVPNPNRGISLGTSSLMFNNVYANQFYQNTSPISTSDARKKEGIVDLSGRYIDMFKKLRPVTYKFTDGDSGRIHSGFIAQEVEAAMKSAGLTGMDFAGLCITPDGGYGLRYEEFIAIQASIIQDLLKRVEALENEKGDDGK